MRGKNDEREGVERKGGGRREREGREKGEGGRGERERGRERGSIGSEVLGRSASGCRLSAEAKSHMKHT